MQFGKVSCPVTSLFTLNQLLKNPLSEFFALKPSTEELVLHSQTNLDVPFSVYINFLINVDIQINTSEQYFRHGSVQLVFVILYRWFLVCTVCSFSDSPVLTLNPIFPQPTRLQDRFDELLQHCCVQYLQCSSLPWYDIRDLKMQRRRQQWECQKSNGLRLAKQQLYMCITLSGTFLCHHSMTTT